MRKAFNRRCLHKTQLCGRQARNARNIWTTKKPLILVSEIHFESHRMPTPLHDSVRHNFTDVQWHGLKCVLTCLTFPEFSPRFQNLSQCCVCTHIRHIRHIRRNLFGWNFPCAGDNDFAEDGENARSSPDLKGLKGLKSQSRFVHVLPKQDHVGKAG